MQKTGQKLILQAACVNPANFQFRVTDAQSRIGGILFALANGKLCFLQQTVVFAAKNHLPHCFTGRGRNTLRSRAFL